ncbi:hypothetical protein [Sphingomonas sp.]|uniref:hypothetical protein n=1 Tax=Sphingomonas sp. TaxID=28214 RepID=UPI003B3ADD71
MDRRLYSECHHCGSDLIRKGRRWHVAAPHELPGDWKAQHSPRWGVPPSLFAAVAGFVLLGALLFLIQR